MKDKIRKWLFDEEWFYKTYGRQIESYAKFYSHQLVLDNRDIIAKLILKEIKKQTRKTK